MNAVRFQAYFALTIALAMLSPAAGRPSTPQYAAMAPLERYLMPRQAEVELARSAAPAAISDHATILVLTRNGYETAAAGTNGFTCVVERSWMKSFDDDQFWNPKASPPVCYNPAASRTVVRYTLFRTQLALAGASEKKIFDSVKSAIAANRLPQVEPGSMAYMMSKRQYIDDHVKAWYPHIMIYTPKADGAGTGLSWGADRKGSPVVYDSGHKVNPEPWALFFVPVAEWSDETPGPQLSY
jgi:hypothetical protein